MLKAWGWQGWDMLSSSVIKTRTQTLRGWDIFFISQSSSLVGLSGPVHRMITALIKDGLRQFKSQDSLVREETCQSSAKIHMSVQSLATVKPVQFHLYSPDHILLPVTHCYLASALRFFFFCPVAFCVYLQQPCWTVSEQIWTDFDQRMNSGPPKNVGHSTLQVIQIQGVDGKAVWPRL